MQKGIHPGFETHGSHHQKFKTVVSVAPRKGLMQNLKKRLSQHYHKLFETNFSKILTEQEIV